MGPKPSRKTKSESSVHTDIKVKIKPRTIHSGNWNLEKYLKLFYLPQDIKDKVNEYFYDTIRFICDEKAKNEIRVLSPGVGSGRNELMLIEYLSTKFKGQIICDFVDYSATSNRILKEKLQSDKYRKLTESIFKKDNIIINIFEEDYTEWADRHPNKAIHDNCSNKDGICFDIILAFFVLNFLPDWRVGLYNTCNLLKPGGYLFVSQDINDLCYLDNTFEPAKKPKVKENNDRIRFAEFWKSYYEERRKYGLDWNSLISPSNMDFMLNIFNDIHMLTNSGIEKNHKDFEWDFASLEKEIPDDVKNFKNISFWYDLIKGTDKSDDDVFNCLCIEKELREIICTELQSLKRDINPDEGLNKEEKYFPLDTIFNNLEFGQRLFYLKKNPALDCRNFLTIVRYSIYSNNFSASSIADFKSLNRGNDRKKDDGKEDDLKELRFHLLNRLLDVYNTLIQNKDKSMLSLFSRQIILNPENNKPAREWRNEDTPKVFPFAYSEEDRKKFILSYALYFVLSEYLQKERKVPRLLTDLIQTKLSKRIGLIYTITKNNESVTPIYFHNSSELKAVVINLDKKKTDKIKEYLNDNILKNIAGDIFSQSKYKKDYNVSKSSDIIEIPESPEHYFFIDKTYKVRDKIKEKLSEIDIENKFLKNIVEDIENCSTRGFDFSGELYSVLDDIIRDTINKRNYKSEKELKSEKNVYSEKSLDPEINSKNSKEPTKEKFIEGIKERFKYIYSVVLSHYVDCNIIVYTSSNLELYSEDSKSKDIEEGFYGLIVSDNVPFVGNERYPEKLSERLVESYYDQLVANTFTYSGMDGLKENANYHKKIEENTKKIAIRAAIAQIMARNMSHNIGSHVIPSQIESLRRSDESSHSQDLQNDISVYGYIQDRMELIANISTIDNSIPIVSDLDNVIENFRLSYNIKEEKKGEQNVIIKYLSENNKCNIDNLRTSMTKPIDVAFPYGTLGHQALFIIIENIIRNICNHSVRYIKVDKETGKQKTTFSLAVICKEPEILAAQAEYYEINIFDNIGVDNSRNNKEDSKIYRDDEENGESKFLKDINSKITRKILDEGTNKLRTGGWGILEMKIAAGFLAFNNILEIDELFLKDNNHNYILDNGKKIPVFSAIFSGGKNHNKFDLGYKFYLKKPQKICLVLNSPYYDKLKEHETDLIRNGFSIKKADEIKNDFKGTMHDIIVLEDSITIANHTNQKNVKLNQVEIESIWNFLINGKYLQAEELVKDKWYKKHSKDCDYYVIHQTENRKNAISEIGEGREGNNKNVVFDRHGAHYDQYNTDNIFYYEPYKSDSGTFQFLDSVNNSNYLQKKIHYYDIMTAVLSKVLIVDERIQEAFGNKDPVLPNIYESKEILPGMGIDVLNSGEFNLNYFKENAEKSKQLRNQFEQKLKDKLQKEYNFIVIHFTLIEKMLQSTDKNIIQGWIDKFENDCRKYCTTLIVISGRGRPSNLPDNCFYLNYAIIQTYTISTRRSKINLIKSLYAARKK